MPTRWWQPDCILAAGILLGAQHAGQRGASLGSVCLVCSLSRGCSEDSCAETTVMPRMANARCIVRACSLSLSLSVPLSWPVASQVRSQLTADALLLCRSEVSSPLMHSCCAGIPLGAQRAGQPGTSFGRAPWQNPPAGTSYGRSLMGASPYGKSVDMVDVVAQLMDGEPLCNSAFSKP